MHSGQTTVVTVFAEALSAPEVAWSLLDAGFNVTSIARRGRGSALRHSRKVVCHEICPPEQDMAQALRDMVSVLNSFGDRHNRPVLLFPLDDTALWMCSELAPNESWIVVGPGKSIADLALNNASKLGLRAKPVSKSPKQVSPVRSMRLEPSANRLVFLLSLNPWSALRCGTGGK